MFSGYSGKEYGLDNTNSALRYAYGDSPLGPWRSGGVLVDSRGVVPNKDGSKLITTNAGHNTHGSLQEINGQWYVFYHRPPRGFGNARQAMVAPVKIEWDKKPVAKGGQVRITGYDPFAPNNEWTAKAINAVSPIVSETSVAPEYTGAEVTSEGFQIYGLPPYAYYSAGIACFMYGPNANQYMQDNHDVWNNSMDLAGIQNGGIIGFKYFGFGGLSASSKGVVPFQGTKKGDDTEIFINLTHGLHGAFKIHVLLDDPWKGEEIATISVPENDERKAAVFSAKVPAVEGLTGKHAIYLIADGPEVHQPEQPQGPWGRRPQQPQRPQGLFDLHGIGFNWSGGSVKVPEVPQITITADGQKIAIPNTPVRSTNQNGYMDATTYQCYAPRKADMKIEAKASDPDVTIVIEKGKDCRATVSATYKGKTKTFLIN